MGIKYSQSESQELMKKLLANVAVADNITNRLSKGSSHLQQVVRDRKLFRLRQEPMKKREIILFKKLIFLIKLWFFRQILMLKRELLEVFVVLWLEKKKISRGFIFFMAVIIFHDDADK